MDSHFLAWAAGFLDGEGCFAVYKHTSGCLIPYIDAAQNVKKPLLALQQGFSYGYIYLNGSAYRWQTKSKKGVAFICSSILPYSIVKKEQIECLLEFCTTANLSRHNTILQNAELREKQTVIKERLQVIKTEINGQRQDIYYELGKRLIGIFG